MREIYMAAEASAPESDSDKADRIARLEESQTSVQTALRSLLLLSEALKRSSVSLSMMYRRELNRNCDRSAQLLIWSVSLES